MGVAAVMVEWVRMVLVSHECLVLTDGRGGMVTIRIVHIAPMAGLEVVKQPLSDGILVTFVWEVQLIEVELQGHYGDAADLCQRHVGRESWW